MGQRIRADVAKPALVLVIPVFTNIEESGYHGGKALGVSSIQSVMDKKRGGRYPLGFLALLILLLAILSFELVICMLLDLTFDNFLPGASVWS